MGLTAHQTLVAAVRALSTDGFKEVLAHSTVGSLGVLVMLIGLVATLAESLFGALVQDRYDWMSNELVNALQTSLAAVLAITAMRI